MVPLDLLTPFIAANAFACATLIIAFWRRDLARWIAVGVFGCAAVINTATAITDPEAHLRYAPLTLLGSYRDFILGPFSRHIPLVVVSIATGQALIALLLAWRDRRARWFGVAGSLLFLAAIAPLGVGAGLPFSITFGMAVVAAVREATPLRRVAATVLWWTARGLGLAMSGLLALFALDVFGGHATLGVALGHLLLHLIPAACVLLAVLTAWRYPRAGAAALFALAVLYAAIVGGRWSWMAVVSAPLVADGICFLWTTRWRPVVKRGVL